MLWSTFADVGEAERVAEAVVAERLAACANILAPSASIYRWHGAVERESEVPVLFKTRLELVERLRGRIAELHGYDLPAIESWSVTVAPAVRDWVVAETGA